MGDINCETKECNLKDFMESYNLTNLVKTPASLTPRCIDLILTNRKSSCRSTTTLETGPSDFHKVILTALEGFFTKTGLRIIQYRDYTKFHTLDSRCNINNINNTIKNYQEKGLLMV